MVGHSSRQPFDAVISVTGSFDSLAASRVRERLEELPPVARVLLDFTHAGNVSDLALAAMAAEFSAHPRPALLRGLTHHQERLLQYLRMEGGLLGPAAPDTGDEP